MSIRVLVPKERTPKEARVALVPDTVSRLIKMGYEVWVEAGAGALAHFPDDSYLKAGGQIKAFDSTLFLQAQVILKVQPPLEEEIELLPEGVLILGFFYPYRFPHRLQLLNEKKASYLAMELIPRISRAQSMDALSSQATVNGYKAALLGANLSSRFFPMLTTAAGTIRPSRVLVMGAGVSGLQAIATAQRLGAIVEAYDVRPTAKEEVESLGAKFISTGVNAEGKGGYARELSEEERHQEQAMVTEHLRQADVVITTAHVPGKPAPKLISEEMVKQMKPGSVIIDVSAESGGNCVLTRLGEVVDWQGVRIFGPDHLPSTLATHASEMYAKNLFHFLNLATQNGKSLELNLKDEIISESLMCHQGLICHSPTRKLVEGER